MEPINIEFNGYWRDVNKSGLPTCQGVYIVYKCRFNKDENLVNLLEILYIGKAENVNERLSNHEKGDSFKKELNSYEELCYSCAEITDQSKLNMIENALIFAQKPLLNDTQKDNYDKGAAIFNFSGSCALLKYTNFSLK